MIQWAASRAHGSIGVCAALVDVLRCYAPAAAITLKWPNDVLVEGAKLAGILLERVDDAVVIGVGVNLANHPETVDRPVTSLAALGGGVPSPLDVVSALARLMSAHTTLAPD